MVVAPDLDGDGARDVIVVSRHDGRDPFSQPRREGPPQVYVDALSGRDGRQLWLWHADLPAGLAQPHSGPEVVGARRRRLAAAGGAARRRRPE